MLSYCCDWKCHALLQLPLYYAGGQSINMEFGVATTGSISWYSREVYYLYAGYVNDNMYAWVLLRIA